MELHAFDVVLFMAQTHNHTLAIPGGNLQILRESFLRYDPAMITAHGKLCRQAGKDIFSWAEDVDRRSHTMINFRKIRKFSAEGFSYGLMSQADTQDRFGGGVFFDQGQEHSSF